MNIPLKLLSFLTSFILLLSSLPAQSSLHWSQRPDQLNQKISQAFENLQQFHGDQRPWHYAGSSYYSIFNELLLPNPKLNETRLFNPSSNSLYGDYNLYHYLLQNNLLIQYDWISYFTNPQEDPTNIPTYEHLPIPSYQPILAQEPDILELHPVE